jgi:hypothetical protein
VVKLNVNQIHADESELIKSIEKLMSPKPKETRWALVDQEKVLEI